MSFKIPPERNRLNQVRGRHSKSGLPRYLTAAGANVTAL